MPRLPVACNIETRDGTLTKDSKLVNCLVDIEGQNAFVVKRPGVVKRIAAAAGAALGSISWEGKIFHATGSSIYQTDYASIPSGSASSPANPSLTKTGVGTVGFEADPYDIKCIKSSSGTLTMIVNDANSYSSLMFNSIDDGVTWSYTSDDDITRWPKFFFYISTTLYCFSPNDGTSASYVRSSTNNGVSFSAYSQIAPPCDWFDYVKVLTVGSLAYIIVNKPNSPGYTNNNTISIYSFNGASYSYCSSLPGIPVSTAYGTVITNFFAHNGKYFVIAKTTDGVMHSYSSSDMVTWSDTVIPLSATSGLDAFIRLNFMSDGNKCMIVSQGSYNTVIAREFDPLTASVGNSYGFSPSNDANLTGFAGGQPSTVVSGKLVLVARDNQNVGDYEAYSLDISVASGGSTSVSPPYSYPFTTVTPGLPLSWVGTSPGTATKRMFIKNTEKAWTLTPGAPGTLTQVTDVDYPAVTVPGVAYLDGFFFVMDKDGTIYNCDLENPTSWNSLNYISAESEWDAGVALAKHQNYVVALKDWTTELFYNAANPTGSPLQRLANAALQIGCASGYSVVQFHGGLIFMSKTREKGRSVHFFPSDSAAPMEIASAAVQRVLNRADLTKVRSWGGKLGGRTMYVLSLATADITLVYDFTTKLWTQFTSDVSGTEGYFKYGFYATDGNRDYLLHETDGDVYEFSPETYQDDGADIKILIRTGRTDSGNLDRKNMPTLEVVGDKQTTNVNVSVSDDDYQTFSALDTVSLDDDPPRLRRLGAYVRRSFDIRHVDNTPLRLLALDAEIKQMR